jgi:hypothetical protein
LAFSESVAGYLKYRVVNRITGAEVISDLPHLHASQWDIRTMAPGGAAAAAIGQFKIPLPAPGSKEFDSHFKLYSLLFPGSGEGYRIEGYLGDVFSATPKVAGIITAVTLSTDQNGKFELVGHDDPWVANAQRFFPGELTPNTGTLNSVENFKRYLFENIPNFADTFNPYNAGSYDIQTNSGPGGSASWSAATDPNGVNPHVVKAIVAPGSSTATISYLCSTTGTAAGSDPDHSHYLEVFMRMVNVGASAQVTIGLCTAPANPYGTSVFGSSYFSIAFVGSQYVLQGAGGTNVVAPIDPDNFLPVQLGFFWSASYFAVTANGSVLYADITGGDPGVGVLYPYISVAATTTSGTQTIYFTNFIHATRYTAKTLGAAAPFVAGSVGTPTKSQQARITQSATELDAWTAIANLQGWTWRYTPLRMSPAIRPPMGTVDLGASPGVDRSVGSSAGTNVIFTEGDNLISITIQGNADPFASDLQQNGNPSSSSGGSFSARNIAAMQTYGWLTDTSLSLTATEFNSFIAQGARQSANRSAPGGAYTAKVRRDPKTADVWRELDYVTVHAPTVGLNMAKLQIIGYTFIEGAEDMTVLLGQYGGDDVLSSAKRAIPGLIQIAGLYKAR